MLENFLNQKPLYYDTIDYTRMPRVYSSIQSQIKIPKIIHIIGTNGKGTTGRFLAAALHSLGFSTGHYTSPHILLFSERIWLNGEDVDNEILQNAHKELLKILTKEDAEALSYFEYTTLLAMWIFQDLEYIVLEAGLGGEHDATAVFANVVTVVTPIGKDHESFLGNTIEEIANTKLAAVQKEAIVAKQVEAGVYDVLNNKKINYKDSDFFITIEDNKKIKKIASLLSLADYLIDNLTTAIATLKFLGLDYKVENFVDSKLFGRLSQFRKSILLDVGHNQLAANVICQSLQGQKYTLIYNTYKDKDYRSILETLKPIIERVEIIDIVDKRAENKSVLQETLKELDIVFDSFHCIDENMKYLVFGSFSVVEAFLKGYNE